MRSYPVQRAAQALFSPEGKQEVTDLITHYLGNAKILRDACIAAGLKRGVSRCYGFSKFWL